MKIRKLLSLLLCTVLIASVIVTTASAYTYTEKLEQLAEIIRNPAFTHRRTTTL